MLKKLLNTEPSPTASPAAWGNHNALYIITETNELFKVTEEGTKKTKIDNVKNVQEIAVDSKDNLYIMDTEKNFFVYTAGESKKIEGLPKATSYAKLSQGTLAISKATFAIVHDDIYLIQANGSAVFFDMRPWDSLLKQLRMRP